MDVDPDEYKPPSSRPNSSRSRRSNSKAATSNGRANGRASNSGTLAAATAAAVAAAGLDGLPPRVPIKPSALGVRSSSGGDGTDAAESGGLEALGLTYDYENYDNSVFGLGGDLDGELGSGGAAASRNRQEKLKEKNRLAQRRFRARQKNMLEQMQARMDELTDQVTRLCC